MHPKHHHPVKGFTLLELMVVIVIVALLFTFAALSFRTTSPEDLVKEEALRFNRLLQLILEEAVFKGEDYGIEFGAHEYRFVALVDNKWTPIQNDKILRLRELPEDVELDLAVEETDIVIQSSITLKNTDDDDHDDDDNASDDNDDDTSDNEDEAEPQVFILSSGEITPEFSVQFYIPTEVTRYAVNATFDGKHAAERIE